MLDEQSCIKFFERLINKNISKCKLSYLDKSKEHNFSLLKTYF